MPGVVDLLEKAEGGSWRVPQDAGSGRRDAATPEHRYSAASATAWARNRSASSAAMQPRPAAVTAWR